MAEASGFSPYVRLWRDWLWPYRWTLSLAILMTVLVSATTGAYSKVIQLVMSALERTDPAVIWWGPLTVLGLTSLSAVGQYYKETISNIVVTHMETDLRKRMFSRLVGADLARLQSEAPAGLAARFSSDISVVGGAVRGYVGGLTNILTIIVSIGVMLTIDWSLTLMILLIFSVALVPVNVIGRRLRKLAKRTQAEISGSNWAPGPLMPAPNIHSPLSSCLWCSKAFWET